MKRLFSVAVLAVTGCGLPFVGGGGTSNESSSSSEYTYEFQENGCKTGKHKADFRYEYCEMLGNHSLNNYCAPNLRRVEYRAKCGTPNF